MKSLSPPPPDTVTEHVRMHSVPSVTDRPSPLEYLHLLNKLPYNGYSQALSDTQVTDLRKLNMSKPLVFVSRVPPPRGMELIEEFCTVKAMRDDRFITRQEMLEGVVGVEGILCHPPDKVDKEVLDIAGMQVIGENPSAIFITEEIRHLKRTAQQV